MAIMLVKDGRRFLLMVLLIASQNVVTRINLTLYALAGRLQMRPADLVVVLLEGCLVWKENQFVK